MDGTSIQLRAGRGIFLKLTVHIKLNRNCTGSVASVRLLRVARYIKGGSIRVEPQAGFEPAYSPNMAALPSKLIAAGVRNSFLLRV